MHSISVHQYTSSHAGRLRDLHHSFLLCFTLTTLLGSLHALKFFLPFHSGGFISLLLQVSLLIFRQILQKMMETTSAVIQLSVTPHCLLVRHPIILLVNKYVFISALNYRRPLLRMNQICVGKQLLENATWIGLATITSKIMVIFVLLYVYSLSSFSCFPPNK